MDREAQVPVADDHRRVLNARALQVPARVFSEIRRIAGSGGRSSTRFGMPRFAVSRSESLIRSTYMV